MESMQTILHHFISNIKYFDDTIKFTFNCSKKIATFLDVNVKMKETCELDTCVHEKFTNVINTWRFHHVILFFCERAFPKVKLSVIDILRHIMQVLKTILAGFRNTF